MPTNEDIPRWSETPPDEPGHYWTFSTRERRWPLAVVELRAVLTHEQHLAVDDGAPEPEPEGLRIILGMRVRCPRREQAIDEGLVKHLLWGPRAIEPSLWGSRAIDPSLPDRGAHADLDKLVEHGFISEEHAEIERRARDETKAELAGQLAWAVGLGEEYTWSKVLARVKAIVEDKGPRVIRRAEIRRRAQAETTEDLAVELADAMGHEHDGAPSWDECMARVRALARYERDGAEGLGKMASKVNLMVRALDAVKAERDRAISDLIATTAERDEHLVTIRCIKEQCDEAYENGLKAIQEATKAWDEVEEALEDKRRQRAVFKAQEAVWAEEIKESRARAEKAEADAAEAKRALADTASTVVLDHDKSDAEALADLGFSADPDLKPIHDLRRPTWREPVDSMFVWVNGQGEDSMLMIGPDVEAGDLVRIDGVISVVSLKLRAGGLPALDLVTVSGQDSAAGCAYDYWDCDEEAWCTLHDSTGLCRFHAADVAVNGMDDDDVANLAHLHPRISAGARADLRNRDAELAFALGISGERPEWPDLIVQVDRLRGELDVMRSLTAAVDVERLAAALKETKR